MSVRPGPIRDVLGRWCRPAPPERKPIFFSAAQTPDPDENVQTPYAIVSGSRSMVLCYALASVVNAVVLFLAALFLSVLRQVPLAKTFSAVYVGAGTFIRPAKVSLALALCPFTRRRTDHMSWPRFLLLLAPFFIANAMITTFAHGTAAVWLWEKVLQPVWLRMQTG